MSIHISEKYREWKVGDYVSEELLEEIVSCVEQYSACGGTFAYYIGCEAESIVENYWRFRRHLPLDRHLNIHEAIDEFFKNFGEAAQPVKDLFRRIVEKTGEKNG